LENVNDVIYAVDGDVFAGQVTFVNSQVERILGYRPQDFVDDATLWIRSVHPEDLPRLMATTGTMMEKAEPVSRIFRIRHKDGNRWVWFEDRVVPKLGSEGRILGILGVARDITARREAELELERTLRQVQRLDSLGRFAGGIAHDLNNLFTILSLAQAEQPGDPALQDAIQRGHDLTKRLMAFVRGEPRPARPIELGTVAADTVTLLRRIVGTDIEIVTEFAPHLAPVLGDVTQIQQLIMNLGANARDAMRNGGRLAIATMALDGADGRKIRLRVSDTGGGMDEETLPKIFEPFFTTKTDGSGLGLATVKQIVDGMGGTISVTSELGRGTTFVIEVPAAPEP
jgi:PAS domain S-box-containing protein